MREFLDSVRYEGTVRPWLEVPETDTSEDEPEGVENVTREGSQYLEAGPTPAFATFDEPPDPVRDSRRVVARAIVAELDGRVWVLYEQPEDFPDVVAEHGGELGASLPGGGAEPDETLADCAMRETREEAGFDVELVAWVCDLDDQHARRRYYAARRVSAMREVMRTDADAAKPVRVECVTVEAAAAALTSHWDRAALAQRQRQMGVP